MAKIITVTNQKGGVGKTTTAHLLSSGLKAREFRTLLIDLDPQSNLTFTMGADDSHYTLYDLFKGNAEPQLAIKSTVQGDIIPGSLLLSGADMEYTQTGREYILSEIIEPLKESYDFVIIDTPPALGILTVNALTASNSVIIPMGADIYSIQGLSQLYNLVCNVKRYTNKELSIDGLFLTRYNKRATISKDIYAELEQLASKLGTKLFKSVIREGVAIKRSQADQTNIFISEPKAGVTIDFNNFIDEYLKEKRGLVNE